MGTLQKSLVLACQTCQGDPFLNLEMLKSINTYRKVTCHPGPGFCAWLISVHNTKVQAKKTILF